MTKQSIQNQSQVIWDRGIGHWLITLIEKISLLLFESTSLYGFEFLKLMEVIYKNLKCKCQIFLDITIQCRSVT